MKHARGSSPPWPWKVIGPPIDAERDVYPAAGPLHGAAILSHGFTRSRRTLAGHAQALTDASVLTLTPDLPCTFDFRCNAHALAALVVSLRAGGAFSTPAERVMLVSFSAGGLPRLVHDAGFPI